MLSELAFGNNWTGYVIPFEYFVKYVLKFPPRSYYYICLDLPWLLRNLFYLSKFSFCKENRYSTRKFWVAISRHGVKVGPGPRNPGPRDPPQSLKVGPTWWYFFIVLLFIFYMKNWEILYGNNFPRIMSKPYSLFWTHLPFPRKFKFYSRVHVRLGLIQGNGSFFGWKGRDFY